MEDLMAFRGLCQAGCGGPHADGWGLVGYRAPGAPHLLGKSVLPASSDKAYEAAAAEIAGFPVVVAHLRKASSGAKTLENTHPFTLGPWTFAHNGTIYGDYAEHMAPRQGLNDSRAFFQRVHEHLRSDPVEALRRGVLEVQERGFAYSSITGLLTDGTKMYAIREVRKNPPEYEMHWQTREGRIVFCQEPVFPGPWMSIPNSSVVIAGSGGVELVKL